MRCKDGLGRRALAALLCVLGTACNGGAAVVEPQQWSTTKLIPVERRVLEKPGYLETAVEPAFGTEITRVSDNRVPGPGGPARNVYSKIQAWNADESLLLLGFNGSGRLLDGTTYRDLGRGIDGAAGGVWSNVDPDSFYSTAGSAVRRTTASTGDVNVLRRFPGVTNLTIGHGEGSPSNDDRTLVLLGESDGRAVLISYDPVADRVWATRTLPSAPDRVDWAGASQSGRYVLVSWFADGAEEGAGVDLLDQRLRFLRHLYDRSEHADMGYDTSGNEVYLTLDHSPEVAAPDEEIVERLVSVRLRDGRAATVLRTDWTGTHVSCRNLDRPGWCFVSDALADRPQARTGGFDEIYALQLDVTAVVHRFAHARQSPGLPYAAHVMAAPSRRGDRVVYASDWLEGAPTEAYVVAVRGRNR